MPRQVRLWVARPRLGGAFSRAGGPSYVSDAALPGFLHMVSAWLIVLEGGRVTPVGDCRLSQRCAVEGDDKLDARDVLRVEAGVVGNEQVNPGRSRAGQLDGVGRAKGTITAQGGVEPCRSDVKGNHV